MQLKHYVLLGVLIITGITIASVFAQEATPEAEHGQGAHDLYNVRYCEIIPTYRKGLKLISEVYNTLGLNDCPAELWDELDGEELAEELDALSVTMNGPRYWLMDTLIGGGETAAGETATFGELELALRGKLEMPLRGTTVGSEFYKPRTIQRTTEYIFSSENPIYTLVSPEGDVYVMQSYAQVIAPELTLEDLADLGERLDLPEGWEYRVVQPDEDLHVIADGTATIINDEFANTYQRMDSPGK